MGLEELPGVVGGAFGGNLLGAGMDVVDAAGLRFVDVGVGAGLVEDPGVVALGEGVDGHDFEVAGGDEVSAVLGGLLLVVGEGIDGAADGVEVFLEDGLAGVLDVGLKGRDGDGGEDGDDRHDDHELEEGEAGVGSLVMRRFRRKANTEVPDSVRNDGLYSCGEVHHVLYFVPSRAVPVDLEWTSKTFCPPQESESASSCMARRPHSLEPVMGSMGMARRNLTFLVWTSTPSTRVSRSGG